MRKLVFGFMMAAGCVGIAQAGDPVIGKQKAESCLACHGGHVTPAREGVTKINHMTAEQLSAAMQKMLEVHHATPIIAHDLTEEDLRDIAAYFAFKGD